MNGFHNIARGNRFFWPDTSCELESVMKLDMNSELVPASILEKRGTAIFRCRKTGIRAPFLTLVLENYDPDEFPPRGRILVEFGESSPEDMTGEYFPGVSPRFYRGISYALGITSLAIILGIILYWLLTSN